MLAATYGQVGAELCDAVEIAAELAGPQFRLAAGTRLANIDRLVAVGAKHKILAGLPTGPRLWGGGNSSGPPCKLLLDFAERNAIRRDGEQLAKLPDAQLLKPSHVCSPCG
jgi:hypothetical protein